MQDAMCSTTQGGGIRLCGMNALRDADEVRVRVRARARARARARVT